MSLERMPELVGFFTAHLAFGDPDDDLSAAKAFCVSTADATRARVEAQLRALLALEALPLDALGAEANRWFESEVEARAWLSGLSAAFGEAGAVGGGREIVVRDSLGAVLAEGDSVLVTKDLDVKGAARDLKRGTLVRKIHLVDDPDVIEARVDGSVLVLKTCFLKKA
jgi:protein PhnA